MSAIPENYGSGGAQMTPGDSAGQPELATVLREVADDFGALNPIPAWAAGIVVAAHTVTLPTAGAVVAVDGDTGAAAGGKRMTNAAPAAGEVQVVYDVAGIPTLNFNAADAITQCAVVQLPLPTIKTTKA